MSYTIYWIKSTTHIDPFNEGYIGLTKQSLSTRFNKHKSNHKNKHLKYRCIKNDVTIIALHENLSSEKAKLIEYFYRPFENIGWNINKGGDIPPPQKGKYHRKGKKHSEETKEKIRQARAKQVITEETKEKLRGKTPWNKGRKDLGGYTLSDDHKKKIGDAKRGKPISEEHRQKIINSRDKMRGKTWKVIDGKRVWL